ncbi:hypothetical protein CYY_005480 [Polysphondylium violaceum]|uniref:EGF-like domain-containing protein n=1 Tax=Polysphondylium violaceum TaxID=133409 RepID=A0A8J4UZK4_9MYCE|nr:hypothetical protein CYY_005480 [Polysphondylium violaceum]
MKNNNFKLLLTFVGLLLISTIAIVNAQDDDNDRFVNPKFVKLFTPQNDRYTYSTINGSSEFYAMSSRDLIYFTVAQLNSAVDGSTTTSSNIFSLSTSDTIGGMTIKDSYVYALGLNTFYKINPVTGDNENIQDSSSLYTAKGAFTFGNNVFFLSSSPVTLAHIDTTLDFKSTNLLFSTITVAPYSFVVDQVNGYAFLGSDTKPDISIVDLNTKAEVGVFTNASITSTFKRSVPIVDTAKKILYYCSTSNNQLFVDVFSYENIATANTIEYKYSFGLITGSDCSTGSIDTYGGQLFFSVTTDSALLNLGTDPQGNNQGATELEGFEVSSLQTFADISTNKLYVVSETQVAIVSYASVCPNDCSGANAGTCIAGVCQCNQEYYGLDCSQKTCLQLNNCSYAIQGNGKCINGECICESIWDGDDCSERVCPGQCQGRGTCSGAPDYTCACELGYRGADCSETYEVPCGTFTESQDCVDHTYCGWCQVDGVCRKGDRYGPEDGFCRTWYFGQNVEVGIIVLGVIFIVLIGILFLIDIGTTPFVDVKRAKDYAEEFKTGAYPKGTHEEASILWWRDQRSAKAWTLMDQFQFISLISHIGVVFPSRFLNFTEYLDWTNMGIPFPPAINPPQEFTSTTGRALLTYSQYENSLGAGGLYHLANILFWFGLLCAAFLVPLLIVFIALNFLEGLIHWKEVIRNRIIHVTVRLLTVGYIGVVMASAYSLVTPLHSYKIIIPGAILVVVYGIGLPIGIFKLLDVPEARLHNPTFKQQFGCLYVNFKPKTDHRFVVFTFIKRFVMAIIVGILAFEPTPVYPLSGTDMAVPIVQVVVIIIVLIGYAVLLGIRKPYFDHYHLWLEYFLTGLNVITVGLSLTHLKNPSVAGELIACLIQALSLIACIAAYIISWLQMRSAFLEKVKKFFGFCKCGKKDKSKNVDMGEIPTKP